MIPMGLALPLLVTGVVSASWRHYRQRSRSARHEKLWAIAVEKGGETPFLTAEGGVESAPPFDDVGELNHYQQVSWYALALAASGSWFYPPAVVLSVPLLGYSVYHLYQVKSRSVPSDWWSPLSVFEMVGVFGALISGRALAASLIFVAAFGGRKWLLRVGNVTNNIGLSSPVSLRNARVWVMRDGVEIEVIASELEDSDIVVFHQGDVILVAGRVVDGAGMVRQFSLSRNMKLLPRYVGDPVHLFTQVETGRLFVRPV